MRSRVISSSDLARAVLFVAKSAFPIEEFNLVDFLVTVHRAEGQSLPPLSVEPASDALEQLPLRVVAEETMFSTLDVLAQAGCSLPQTV
jgi:hypothetical protein